MNKVLISMLDQLTSRMKAAIAQRQPSKIIARLIKKEIEKDEQALYECAVAVEKTGPYSVKCRNGMSR